MRFFSFCVLIGTGALLGHQPANFERAAGAGIDLQVSGHTHGGQIVPLTARIGPGQRRRPRTPKA